MANANSDTTSALCHPRTPASDVVTEPAFRCRATLTFERRAGITLSRIPHRTHTAALNRRTGVLRVESWRRGTSMALVRPITRMIAYPRSTPTTPPTKTKTRFSASICRTIRQRPVSTAARRAVSGSRATPRASSRLTMLTHATSRTNPTDPHKISSTGRVAPTTYS
jgi:hypothetical protein